MEEEIETSPNSPTQKDVARLAGVSQTTVSVVLNNPETKIVNSETRSKIFEAITTLGYIRNSTARNLRTSRTDTLACIIPMITNPFYPAFVSGVQSMAEAHGYDVIIYNTHASSDREWKYLEAVQQRRVDGVIGVFFYTKARELLPLLKKKIAIVRLEVRRHSIDNWPIDNIFVDNVAAARKAATYLIEKGHTRLVMVTGPAGPREARREGFIQAVKAAGPDIKSQIVEVSDYNENSGLEGMMQVLKYVPRPTAVFAANDLMAIGVIRAIHTVGLDIPKDISVIGFDDIPAAQLVNPSLTTMRQYQEKMGQRAAELVIQRLKGDAPAGGRNVEMPCELIIRQSA